MQSKYAYTMQRLTMQKQIPVLFIEREPSWIPAHRT